MAVLRTVFAKKQETAGVKIGRLGLMAQTPSNRLVCLVAYLTNALLVLLHLLHVHLSKKPPLQLRQACLIYLNGRPVYSPNDGDPSYVCYV